MAGKPKSQIAREHLEKAQAEEVAGDTKDAVQWVFASLEAAIDALADRHDIAIDQKHWKRSEAAEKLHKDGVLPEDLSDLHMLLNEERKGVFYDGEEPELGDWSMEDILISVEKTVEIAEASEDT